MVLATKQRVCGQTGRSALSQHCYCAMTVLCGVTQPGCTALTVVLFFVSRLSRHYLPLRPMVRMPKATSHQELSSCRSWPRAGGCCCPHCLTASVCRRAGPVLPCCPSHCACTACRDKARWWLNVGLQCPLQCPRVSILGAYHLRGAGCPLATETCRSGALHRPLALSTVLLGCH